MLVGVVVVVVVVDSGFSTGKLLLDCSAPVSVTTSFDVEPVLQQ